MSTLKVKPVLVAGLDIGSTKVSLAISSLRADGTLEIIGLGTAPNKARDFELRFFHTLNYIC